jgi:ATP-dependent metalloprotease FtsH
VLKLKTLFRQIRRHGKAIVFIDEIDSMGSRRQGDKGFGGMADMNMTLNTLLTEMDGFHGSEMMVIGATNNDAGLDPALMRAGRMDRRIYFQAPDPEERKELFKYYLGKVAVGNDIDFEELAKLTSNYSPAEIASAVNEAALICVRPGGPGKVTMAVLEQALNRASVGLERSLCGSGVEYGTGDAHVRLNDVIGIDEVKQDILEVIDFLKHGDALRKIGAKVPKGVLLIGPPGVGKTMLAKAMANEANVPFFGMSASFFSSKYVGEGADRIRALYSQARKSPAAIIFIDEIDAISGTSNEAGNNRTSELQQLLIELDGFQQSNVITVGATNNETNLDPAFMRSGRFDRKAYVGLPDAEARKKIFVKYLAGIKMKAYPDLEKIGQQSVNFSGADIAACVNEAAIIAVRKGKDHVEESDLEEAIDRLSVTAGHKLNTHGMNLSRVPDLDVKLEDVKGIDEAKAEAAEVVAFLKNAEKIRSTGLKAPKGVLLVGPPGTGKTMLAKAIANEAGVPFFSLSGGDFQSMWAGVGANRIRAVYEQARRGGKPCIVFIDEIDAIGGKRGIDRGGGAVQDSNKTLNQFLVELDGFGKHKVLTIGATNNEDMLDRALLRPGRFDRIIEVPMPRLDGREAMFLHYLKDVEIDATVQPLEIARMTVWRTGADIANIVNEAGLFAIRDGRTKVSQVDLVKAVQRNSFGMSYSRQVLLEDLVATAWHEAGHALVAYYRNKRDRIQIVTVVPSSGALGYVWYVDKNDRDSHKTREECLTRIEIALGSYVAEKIHMGTTEGGVIQDLKNAADMASTMVREFGMGKFKFNTAVAFGGRHQDYISDRDASDETKREIELEIKEIIDQCMKNVEELLHSHRRELELIATGLVEKETLYYRDLVAILEPQRSQSDIDSELAAMGERKLVGRQAYVGINSLILGGGSSTGGNGGGSTGGNGGSSNNQSSNASGRTDGSNDFSPPTDKPSEP